MSVFQIINQQAEEAQVVEDLEAEVDLVEDLEAEVDLVEEVDLTEDHEKCTRRPAETAARIVKFHSSQDRTNQSTATNVFQIIKGPRNILV
jgi:hypothetical protein